jgi:hypothetical protein
MPVDYYQTHRDKALAYQRQYRRTHIEQINSKSRLPIQLKQNLSDTELTALLSGQLQSYVLTPVEILDKYNRRRKKKQRGRPRAQVPVVRFQHGAFEVRFD